MADAVRHDAIAADGTPIGSVAAFPNGDEMHLAFKASEFDPNTGFVTQIEKAMSAEAMLDITNRESPEFIPDDVVDRLLPGYRDSEKRGRALALYVDGSMSLRDIASSLDVPERTVAKWAEVGDWISFQENIARTLKKHEKVRLAIIRTQKREEMMNEQIELGHKINAAAKEHIEAAETAGQLKMAAEAAKLGSDMSNRALGIGESGDVDAKSEATVGGSASLVQIFTGNNGLPPVRIPGKETIDV